MSFEHSIYTVLIIVFTWGCHALQKYIHKLSHVIVDYYLEGRDLLTIKPCTHKQLALRYSIPMIVSWCISVLLLTLIYIIYTYKGFNLFLFIFIIPFIFAFIDFTLFWWGYLFGSKHCDGKRYKAEMNKHNAKIYKR